MTPAAVACGVTGQPQQEPGAIVGIMKEGDPLQYSIQAVPGLLFPWVAPCMQLSNLRRRMAIVSGAACGH